MKEVLRSCIPIIATVLLEGTSSGTQLRLPQPFHPDALIVSVQLPD